MASEICRACKFVRPINETDGKCKHDHPERKLVFAGGINEVRIDNGWPTVKLAGSACGEWKALT